MLFIVTSTTCGGKNTLVGATREVFPDIGLSVSWTTRNQRSGEIAGVDYHYTTRNQFTQMILSRKFIEHAEVFGNYYGTLREVVRPAINDEADMIVVVDYQGAMEIIRQVPKAHSIFVVPPSLQEVERRLRERNRDKDEKDISVRLSMATYEMKRARYFKYRVMNDDLHAATADMVRLFESLRSPGAKDLSVFQDPVVLDRALSQFPALV